MVMKKATWVICMVLSIFSFGIGAMAQDEDNTDIDGGGLSYEEVVVTGKKIVTPTRQTNETVYTGTEITRKGLEAQGSKASMSIYEAIDILPGVVVEGSDSFGLAAEQRYIRIRGVRGYFGALTVEGIPNYGGNPMGPRDYIYDMENLNSIAVYNGAVPADLGTGVGARGGAIELRPMWPLEEFTVDFRQGIGEYGYTRSFLRIDSGELLSWNTAISASYSYAETEKWRGPGHVGPRNNVSFMLSQPMGNLGVIRLWYNYNCMKQHLYRPLTYAEVEDLHGNYHNDYNDELVGINSVDIDYYGYNRGEYANHDVFMVIPVTLSDSFILTLKPYYSKEDADISGGLPSMGGVIRERERDIERYGIISQLDWDSSWVTASLGYWYESSDMVIRAEMYEPGSYEFRGYGMYLKNDGNGIVNSPFFKLAGKYGRFRWQGGVKYFHYTDPAGQGYVSSPPSYESVEAEDLYREENVYDEFLPTAGISYRISDSIEFYSSYGRNQIRPYAYMPLINLYNQQRAKFQAAGITLNELFDGYDMEISDNYEVGSRFEKGMLEIAAAVFYSEQNNLLTKVYDPRVDLDYYQNVGDATGYGVEMGINAYLEDYATFFLNTTYTSLTYDDDLTYQGTTLDTEDNQVVDVPEWTLKSGVIFTRKGFQIVLKERYVGERYGNAEHTEKIDDHIITDFSIGYTKNNLSVFKSLKVMAEFTNIFNEEYVSGINPMDSNRGGNPSYYVGAPRTALMKLSMQF